LIARHENLWDALEAAFAGVGDDEAGAAEAGAWSAKDHLAHVVVWERHRLAVLRGDDVAAAMGFAPAEWAGADDDALNARIAERSRGRPVAALRGDLRRTRAVLAEALRTLPAERLATAYRVLHPEDDGRGDGPVGEWAVGLAEAHVGAHLGPIRARLAEARGEPPPTVPATLARIDAATVTLLGVVGEAAGSETVDGEGWRVADHAFHVVAWDRACVALLDGSPRWEAVGVAEAVWRSGDTDRINAAIFAAGRARPTPEALAALEESRAALRDAVASLEDDDLLAAYGAFQPDDRPMNFAPVYGWVAENGWVHPGDHAGAVARIGPGAR